jgi:hypothetical protein
VVAVVELAIAEHMQQSQVLQVVQVVAVLVQDILTMLDHLLVLQEPQTQVVAVDLVLLATADIQAALIRELRVVQVAQELSSFDTSSPRLLRPISTQLQI